MGTKFSDKYFELWNETEEFIKSHLKEGEDVTEIRFGKPIEISYYNDAFCETFSADCYGIRIYKSRIECLGEGEDWITPSDFLDTYSLVQIADLLD